VFAFAFAVAGAAALLFALLPALQASRLPLTDALRGQRSGHHSSSRTRNALVVAQVAVSVVLVVIALLLSRNFTSLASLDLGYSTTNVYSLNVRSEGEVSIARLADALSSDPRIASVAVTGGNPLFVTHTAPAGPEGQTATPTQFTFVSPEYFTMLQMPVVHGRPFRPDEARAAARVAIISDSTARAFWPGADPVGRTIRFERPTSGRMEAIDGYTQVTVIGTVHDVVSGLMFEGTDRGHIYLPATAADPHASALLFTPRAAGGFRAEVLRDRFRALGYDPDLFELMPLEEMRVTEMYPMRAASWVGALLGGVALLLSIAGLYGVLSYTLAQRTREIGIRMALGATASAVVGLVMRQSARMAVFGVGIGLVVSFSALKALSSVVQLRQVSFLDPVSFAAAVLVVAAATALAAYYPSRRATRIDPAETLRAEA
jgi:predicted permease